MREYARQKFEEYFPNKGDAYETILYNAVIIENVEYPGWDFYQCRMEYKRKLIAIINNLQEHSNLRKMLFEDSVPFQDIIHQENQVWEPNLWKNDFSSSTSDSEIREGTFSCSNCARKNIYHFNTSHFEQQTRSADEPMTIFMHCHTCSKDYRFSS